jgi:hypothetical protein
MLGNMNINIEVLVRVLFILNNVQHPKKKNLLSPDTCGGGGEVCPAG